MMSYLHVRGRVMAIGQSPVASSAQAQERLAVCLAMIAGYVDAYGFLSYATYLSLMSGNTTQTGLQTGQGNVAAAVPALLAIGFFVIGVLTGTLLIHSSARRARRLV